MKFIVGYQMLSDSSFLEQIIAAGEHIQEVYFSWGDFPNGRSSLLKDDGMLPYEKQKKQEADLKRLSDAQLRLNLLFNGNCYGKDSQSRLFFHRIGDTVDYIRGQFGLSTVTTSSLLIARFLHENFPGIDVRASVNMEIGSTEGMEYVADLFDSFYIRRECNRNKAKLTELKKWCDENGKKMYLLANSGCLNNCSAHTFHDNLVSHEAEIAGMDNGYQFNGICWEYLKQPGKSTALLERTNFIRPEDIPLYEPFTSAVKLATRVNSAPGRILEAYLNGHYRGGMQSLLEPDHSGVLYPYLLENSLFPSDFGKQVMECDHRCSQCGYCKEVFEKATINLGGMFHVNQSKD